MGVLVKYTIELEAADLTLIGEALDALPHGRVAGLVARVQAQISAQERAAAVAATKAELDRAAEIEKRGYERRASEEAQAKSRRSRREGK